MTPDYREIYNAMMDAITASNIKVTDRSRVRVFSSCAKLIEAVKQKFLEFGYDEEYVNTILKDAMLFSISHICKDWHGMDKDAKFIVNAYISNHNMPALGTAPSNTAGDLGNVPVTNSSHTHGNNSTGNGTGNGTGNSTGGTGGTGGGNGTGGSTAYTTTGPRDFTFPFNIEYALSSSGPVPDHVEETDEEPDWTGNLIPHDTEDNGDDTDDDDDDDDDDYDDDDDDDDDDEDDDTFHDDGEEYDGERHTEQSEHTGNNGVNDVEGENMTEETEEVTTPAQQTEIPPEDMPITPGYKPPAIWEVCLKIIRYNLEHPDRAKNIMLVGPKGIGKTRMVLELSKKVFGKEPYAITSPQQPHELTGYADATGNEVKSNFSRGYDQPGIILIDEMDRSDEGTVIKLNPALGNKFMDVPVRGLIKQNPHCTVIATANTSGTGATNDYNTARQLDASTRDRFVFFLMQWDHETAMGVAKGDESLVRGLEDWNNACDKMGYTSGQVSYRTILDMQDMMDYIGLSFDEALKSSLIKYAIEKSDLKSIYNNMESKSGKVAKAVKRILDAMPDRECMC